MTHAPNVNAGPFDVEWDYSAKGIARQLEDSLQRLGMASVDSLVIHGMDHAVAGARAKAAASHADPRAAEDAVFAQLEGPGGGLSYLRQLKARGTVKAFGLALNEENPIFPTDEAKRVAWNAATARRLLGGGTNGSNGLDFLLVAGMHTLLNFTAWSSGILDAALDAGVVVLAAAPFNSGILARDASVGFEGSWFSYSTASPSVVKRAEGLAEACRRHNVSLRAAALAFPSGHPAVVSVVVGAKSAAEWRDCVALARERSSIPALFWDELRSSGLVPSAVPLPLPATPLQSTRSSL
jgi:D-threo-aldose 1-dehydrogenase